MKTRYLFLPLAILFLGAACSPSNFETLKNSEGPTASVQPKVIYGDDNRLDFYQILDPAWQERASSTVALISPSKITPLTGGGVQIKTNPYGKSQNLCTSEPFYDEVSAAFCSGSLITPDIVLTAGHCVRSKAACLTTKFVFNYAYQSPAVNPTTIAAGDTYSCKELIHSITGQKGDLDFALVRLDHPVVGHKPLAVNQTTHVAVGDPMAVIGYPQGLPVKMAGGATVRKNGHRNYFVANLDTYGGNSGSPVFNETTGLIEGVLVRGEQDFVFDSSGCYKSNVCPADGCRGEDVTRVSWALKYIDPTELTSN